MRKILLTSLVSLNVAFAANHVCVPLQDVMLAAEKMDKASSQDLFSENPSWDSSLECKKKLFFALFQQPSPESAEQPSRDEIIKGAREGYGQLNDLMDQIVRPVASSHNSEKMGSVNARVIEGGDHTQAILYLHGGGYMLGLEHVGNSYTNFTHHLAQRTHSDVYMPDYRLVPENSLQASLDDALESYRYLLEKGYKPENIIVAGDSAGGGLALRLLLKLKNEKMEMPKGAVLLSPWTDLTNSGETMLSNAHKAVIATPEGFEAFTPIIVESVDNVKDPLYSPLFGDYEGFPPLLYSIGGREIMYDDTARDVEKARAQGVKVEMTEHEDGVHVYPVADRFLPEASEAMDYIVDWINQL